MALIREKLLARLPDGKMTKAMKTTSEGEYHKTQGHVEQRDPIKRTQNFTI